MAHQREIIRKAVRQAIEDAATDAGARVYASRVLPLRRLELPAVAVYTLSDKVDQLISTAPRELERSLELVVEGWVAITEDSTADDLMDDLAGQLETAMHADPYFAGAVGDSLLESTELELVEQGDRMMGLIVMTYTITYYTLAPVAPTTLDDFTDVSANHNLGGVVHEDDDAHDDFVVQVIP